MNTKFKLLLHPIPRIYLVTDCIKHVLRRIIFGLVIQDVVGDVVFPDRPFLITHLIIIL